jgi:hypothetical protein
MLLATAATLGCGRGAATRSATDWRAEIDTIGDTVVVHTVAGSERGAAQLVEAVRIGAVEGADYEIFGEVAGIAVDGSENIYVYDAQVPVLREYTPDGQYLRTLGRKGRGPGEYTNSDGGLAVLSDGRVVLRDPGNGRFTVFAPDGEFLVSWPTRGSAFTDEPVVPTPDGGFVSPVFGRDEPERLVRYSPDGTPGDSMAIPTRHVESATVNASVKGASQTWSVPFTPAARTAFHPDGYWMAAASDVYAVDLLRPGRPILRIERDIAPVAVAPEERAAEEERVTAAMRRLDPSWRWNGPPIPKTKPVIRDLYGGDEGRVWVLRYQPGQRVPDAELAPKADGGPQKPQFREPVVFDVFEKDGRYQGQATAPAHFSVWPRPVFRGDAVWATERDANGVQFVVRYRVVWERAPRNGRNGSSAGGAR